MPTVRNRSSRAAYLAIAALMAGVGLWSYWPTLKDIVSTWSANPDYSHGYLVPLISVWLLWLRRGAAPDRATFRADPTALLLIGGVALLRGVAARVYLPELDALTIPLWIGGVVWLVVGRAALVWAAPAIAFLWFAMPLPASLETAFSDPLQLIAADASGVLLRSLGQPAVTEGATILLGDQTFEVERACSGLRMFFGIAALAAALVIVLRPKAWQAVLLLFAVPAIAIGANVLRVTLTALLQAQTDSDTWRQLAHDYAALLLLPVAAVGLLITLAVVRRADALLSGRAKPHYLRAAIGIAIVVGAGWAISQSAQRGQEAAAERLLQAAESHRAQGDFPREFESLRRYTVLRDQDADKIALLGDRLWEQNPSSAGARQAFPHYLKAWRVDSASPGYGLAAAHAAYQTGGYQKAIDLANEVLHTTLADNDAESAVLLRAEAALARSIESASGPELDAESRQALEAAAELDRPLVRYVAALAADYEARSAPSLSAPLAVEATALLDRLVEQRPEDPAAWVTRHRLHRGRVARLPEAEQASSRELAAADLEQAIRLAEKSGGDGATEAFLLGAADRQESGDPAEAERLYRLAIESSPRDYRGYLGLAELLRLPGSDSDLEAAVAVLEEGVSALGRLEVALSVRLASLRAELGQADLAEEALGPVVEAMPRIPASQRGRIALAIELVRARFTRKTEGYAAAATRLAAAIRDSAPVGSRAPADLMRRAYDRLGNLQAAAGWHSAAVQSLLSARALGPLRPESSRLLANAAALSEDFDLSEATYRRLLVDSPEDATLRGGLLSVAVRRLARDPQAGDAWEEMHRRLAIAIEKGLGDPTSVLLRGEILVGEGKPAEAAELLDSAVNAAPDSAPLWRGLATFRQQAGDEAGAVEAAERYVELSGGDPRATGLLARLFVLQGRLDEAARVARDAGADGSDSGVGAAIMLADVELRRGDVPEAMAILRRAADAHPSRLAPIQSLAQLALAVSDWPTLSEAQRRLRQVEGEQGVYWRVYGAEQRLALSQSVTDPRFAESSRLAEQLLRLRPHWPESHFLQGEVERRLGNQAAAVRHYGEAWRRGKRDARTADRLLASLADQGRFERAANVTAQIADLIETSPRLFDRVASVSTELVANERLVEVARGWVKTNPRSAEARLRLARALLLTGAASDQTAEAVSDEASALLREAVRLAPTDENVWASALLLEAQGGPLADSLDALASETPLDPLRRHWVLAKASAAAGDRLEAGRQYDRTWRAASAEGARADAPRALASAADYYASESPYLAERLARRAIALEPESPATRLALVRALVAGEGGAEEGLALLDGLGPEGAALRSAPQTLLLRSELLRRRSRPGDRKTAIELLTGGLGASRAERLLLAKLYDETGAASSAADRLIDLIDSDDARFNEQTAFVEFWQRRFSEEEDPAFGRRVGAAYHAIAASPGGAPVWLRWKLRELRRQEQPLETDQATPLLVRSVELGAYRSAKGFASPLRVALEEGAEDAALRVAERPPESITSDAALTGLLQAMVRGEPWRLKGENQVRLERLIAEHRDAAEVRQAEGELHLLSGRYDQACAAFEAAVEADPDRPLAYNNLALAWVERNGAAEPATRWLGEAVARGGELAEFEDSRAWIVLRTGDVAEALASLESLAGRTTEPSVRLHLAMALHATGRSQEASDELLSAIALGIERQPLLPREREFLDRIKGEIVASEADPTGPVAGIRTVSSNATPRFTEAER